MLKAGQRPGPYEIQTLLGAGGMGEVYRARDTRLERTVAPKVLAPAVASDVQFKERFLREASTASQFDHPNICAVFDISEFDRAPYIVMQYLDGQTLRERIARGDVPLQTAMEWATQIAGALVKAHEGGVIHRDLKPANVMITSSGAKLLDFGIAGFSPRP